MNEKADQRVTLDKENSDNDNDEFYDAKESWEEDKFESNPLPETIGLPKGKSIFNSLTAPWDLNSSKPKPSEFWKNHRTISRTHYEPRKNLLKNDDLFSISKKPKLFSMKEIKDKSLDKELTKDDVATPTSELPIESLKITQEEIVPQIKNRIDPLGVVRTQKSMKDRLEFDNITLQQELRAGAQAIWVARFSADGCYFAVGGEERIIRIWEIGDYSQQCI